MMNPYSKFYDLKKFKIGSLSRDFYETYKNTNFLNHFFCFRIKSDVFVQQLLKMSRFKH